MLESIHHQGKPFTLGILGGGQLAKMLANEAYRLGLNIAIIENHSNSPAGDMTKLDFTAGWSNEMELDRFIEISDRVTLENEFIDPMILEHIEKSRFVYPTSSTMKLIQDKFIQKNTFSSNGIPVPRYAELPNIESAIEFGKINGFPFVIKARKYGYDGYGNATVNNELEVEEAWTKFNSVQPRPLMAEEFVNFSKELAVMVARGIDGASRVYPCVETIQKNHICHKVIAPSMIDGQIAARAQHLAQKCVDTICGIGVFGIELFLSDSDEVLVNEIAPRPHNSGHYTIEACYASQFENAIRAVCGLPLGSTEMIKPGACMINLLGERDGIGVPNEVGEVLAIDGAKLHLYNKKSSRQGRKMGHITALGNSALEAIGIAELAYSRLKW